MSGFQALPASTVGINVAATTARVLIGNFTGTIDVLVTNLGSAEAYVEFGDVTIVATTTTSIPVEAGQSRIFTVQSPANKPLYMAAIAAGTTGYIHATPGGGG